MGLNNSSAKICPENTILIAMYGQGKTRGMTALLKTNASTNQACACILPSKEVNPYYLWNNLIFCYDDLRNQAKGGNQPNLNADIIKKYKVIIPPIELQNKFAEFVTHIEKLKSKLKDNIQELETLLASRMHHYFGE